MTIITLKEEIDDIAPSKRVTVTGYVPMGSDVKGIIVKVLPDNIVCDYKVDDETVTGKPSGSMTEIEYTSGRTSEYSLICEKYCKNWNRV